MKRVLIFLVAAACAFPFVANAAEYTLNPIADSPVFALNPNQNYGSQTYGYWGYYNYPFRTLIKYDCSTVSGAVTKVELSFQLMQNNTGTGKMWACKLNGDWQEMTVTWATQPTHDDTTAGRLLDIDWVTGLGPHRVDCTAAAVNIVQGWINNPNTNYGLILKKDPESGNEPRCYPYMKESSYQPVRLIITTATPVEPYSLGKVKALFK